MKNGYVNYKDETPLPFYTVGRNWKVLYFCHFIMHGIRNIISELSNDNCVKMSLIIGRIMYGRPTSFNTLPFDIPRSFHSPTILKAFVSGKMPFMLCNQII